MATRLFCCAGIYRELTHLGVQPPRGYIARKVGMRVCDSELHLLSRTAFLPSNRTTTTLGMQITREIKFLEDSTLLW